MPQNSNSGTGKIEFKLISPLYCDINMLDCILRVYFFNPPDYIDYRPECKNNMSFTPQLLYAPPTAATDCSTDVNNKTQWQTHVMNLTVMVDDYISSPEYDYRDYYVQGAVGNTNGQGKWSNYFLPLVKV